MSFFDDLENKAQERKDYLSFDKQIDLINKNIATPSIINANNNLTQEQVAIKDQALRDKQQRANSELMAAPVGMLEGMVGFGGDIERLGRGAVGAVTASNGSRWDTFLNELGNSDTTLWNTENVQDWTNKQLEGTDFGNRLLEGKGGRLFGEILAPAPPIAGAMKYGGKALDFLDEGATFANKYLNKFDIQPGLSIKDVSVDAFADQHKLYHGGNKSFAKKLEGKRFNALAKNKDSGSGGNRYGLSTTTKQETASDFAYGNAGNDGVVSELYIHPEARVLNLDNPNFLDDMSEAELKKIAKDYDVVRDVNNTQGEGEYRILTDSILRDRSQLESYHLLNGNKTTLNNKGLL